MDFAFSEEQEMLRSSARDFLNKECPPSFVRRMLEAPDAWDAGFWKKLAELGSQVNPMSAEQFQKFLQEEERKLKALHASGVLRPE